MYHTVRHLGRYVLGGLGARVIDLANPAAPALVGPKIDTGVLAHNRCVRDDKSAAPQTQVHR